jgi:hypothetical protein
VPTRHVVVAGESVVSLSEKYGLFSQTIWDAPENDELRAKRPDMNTLLPGDVVVIPDKREKEVDAATGKRHCFHRKGIPAYFRMQLYDFGKPRRNEAYELVVDDAQTIRGTTDDQGMLETPLPARARKGLLTIGPDKHRLQLMFGRLDPLDTVSGVQQRLENLGYPFGDAEGTLGDGTRAALQSFQQAQALKVTGEIDDATRARLRDLHDAEAPTTEVASQGAGAS